MRLSRLAIVLVPVTAAMLLAAASSARKDPYGVYAVVDSVTFDSAAPVPQRVRIWGTFAVANVVGMKDGKINHIQFGHFHPPQTGFMYYSVNPRDEIGTRAQWAALKSIAGTGAPAAWGASLPPVGPRLPATMQDTIAARYIMTYNGRVRTPMDSPADPDVFPQTLANVHSIRANPVRAAQLGLPVRTTGSDSPRRMSLSPSRD